MARIAIFDTRYSPKRCGVRGKGQLLLNDVVRTVSAGESVIIHKEDCYSIKAIDELHIIEVQIGDELIEEDIERFEWNWQ